jgi:hypothetical protein
MGATYVSYDLRSGQIIGVHYGAPDADYVRRRAALVGQIPDAYIGVSIAPADAASSPKFYRIDPARRQLVESDAITPPLVGTMHTPLVMNLGANEIANAFSLMNQRYGKTGEMS